MNNIDSQYDPKGLYENKADLKHNTKYNREEGYYWVKYGGDWIILTWDGTQWTNNDCYYDGKDSDMDEIYENRIVYENT